MIRALIVLMLNKKQRVGVLSAVVTLLLAVTATAKNGSKTRNSDVETTNQARAVLWREPRDIKSHNLFYGPGGPRDAPHTEYTFEKEDLEGTSPKFMVRDAFRAAGYPSDDVEGFAQVVEDRIAQLKAL
jgi:hypothetical protein